MLLNQAFCFPVVRGMCVGGGVIPRWELGSKGYGHAYRGQVCVVLSGDLKHSDDIVV